MDDWKAWRLWFLIAGIGAVILIVLPFFGIPID